jgi:DNA (cytosine-5)-methyltransferase 1
MAKLKRILAADLFCGAGGTSTGLLRAAELLNRRVELTAVNHWDRAIETHSANHPGANHFCQSLADLDPKRAVPGGKLDLLVASPECTHHSVARGGKPVNDQSRASAYCVHRWCAALDVKRVLIENVPEFQSWGPLGTNGKPLASKKGVLFEAFVNTMKAMGYRVEWRVLNAADYGGATTRRRLFIQAAKGKVPIHWPARTHEPAPTPGLFGETLTKWRAARGSSTGICAGTASSDGSGR